MASLDECDVAREFEGAALGDQRLSSSLVKLAVAMGRDPGKSLPRILSGAALEAAYRFFGNTKVEPNTILAPHVRQTLGRIADQAVVLVIHDSSTISYNSEGEREGLTPTRGTKQSFMLHCSLAARADGTRRPEGVLAASYHVPTDADGGVLQARWSEHIREVHAHGVATSQLIHLMDREADDYEVLDLLTGLKGRFVIRVKHDRQTERRRLRSLVDAATIHAEREIQLSKRSGKLGPKQKKIHPPRKSRMAKVCVAAASVTLQRTSSSAEALQKEITLNVVRVWEASPPQGEPAVEWVLYTTEAIDTAEQVLSVVDWYRARWTIEEYFKALKSGCAVEKRQLDDLDALVNATAVSLPLAYKLLLVKSEYRNRPEQPAETVLDSDELTVLRMKVEKPLPESPTVSDVVLAIARLGGHLKHNGPPGWQSLAQGYERLQAWVEGWQLRRLFDERAEPNDWGLPATVAARSELADKDSEKGDG